MAEEEVERPGGFKFQFIEVCGGLWGCRLGIAPTGPDECGCRRCLRSIDEQAVYGIGNLQVMRWLISMLGNDRLGFLEQPAMHIL